MNTVRRIASEILGVGESKVRFKNEAITKISDALTREDVRSLIKDGSIVFIAPRGVSRIRGRAKQAQLKKGRRKGKGSKRGTLNARKSGKETWMQKVRAQRKCLRALVEADKIDRVNARKTYLMIKGNAFKGVKILEIYLKDNKMLKQ